MKKLINNLIHLIFLGIFKSLISILFLIAKIFNIYSILTYYITKNIELLVKSDIDFVPNEMLKDDKIIGYIAKDYVKFVKTMY